MQRKVRRQRGQSKAETTGILGANSAGRWMAKLAARYPAQFTKSDTEQARGWRITG